MFWPAYCRGNAWRALSDARTTGHILQTHSGARKGTMSLPVSFNLLTGSLLVDNLPIAALPDQYRRHTSFRLLFGFSVPKVIVSNRKGMDFSCWRKHHGWDVHFSLQNKELVVQAIKGDQVCEFVPPTKLGPDFPLPFRRNYCHWVNMSTRKVEFRPHDSCWQSSAQNWILHPKSRTLTRGNRALLGLYSKIAVAISQSLQILEDPDYISCVLHEGVVEIDLPRFQLSFLLNSPSDSIWSKNYAGMCIAEDQFIGTLIGLKNRLVLTTKGSLPQLNRRIVLVPRGLLSSKVGDNGVTVSVSKTNALTTTSSVNRALAGTFGHSSFQVDERLGKLDDSGFLQEKLYLAHLHALTSFCLPDPLTGRTGTEECLRILNSASVKSFQSLDKDSLTTLENLSRLSPQRSFYPSHLTAMETVHWQSLPMLSQDDAIGLSVQDILTHNQRCQVFDSTAREIPATSDRTSSLLVQRAVLRNSVFRVSGFGAKTTTKHSDIEYDGRPSRVEATERGTRAAAIASLVVQREAKLVEAAVPVIGSLNLAAAGTKVEGASTTTQNPLQPLSIDVQVSFSKFLDGQWCRLHEQLSSESTFDRHKYRLSAMFAVFGFSRGITSCWQTLQTIVAFITVPQMRLTKPPDLTYFPLSFGKDNVGPKIRTLVSQHTCTLKDLRSSDDSEWSFNNLKTRHFPSIGFDGELRTPMPPAPSPESLVPVAALQVNFIRGGMINACPESRLAQQAKENKQDFESRKMSTHHEKVASVVSQFVDELEKQWPCQEPLIPATVDYSTYINLTSIRTDILKIFDDCWRNLQFHDYMEEISSVMSELPIAEPMMPVTITPLPATLRFHSNKGFTNLDDLMTSSPPELVPLVTGPLLSSLENCDDEQNLTAQPPQDQSDPIRLLVKDLEWHASDLHEKRYVEALGKSAEAALEKRPDFTITGDLTSAQPFLMQHLENSNQALETATTSLREILTKGNLCTRPAAIGSHWPRISCLLLLQQLSRKRWPTLQRRWKRCLVDYALALTAVQRAERLIAAKSWAELLKEVDNVGHTNWDPIEYPEALLLEVESNLLIRPVQQDIASTMMKPDNNQSSVMQLNMGEGKSSVIVPLVAAAQADTSRLVRVIVAKPQSKQMCQMMTAKLGGLLDRRMYFLPISRSLRLGARGAEKVRDMLSECRAQGGVLLVQPEQLLSFKLMGIENACMGKAVPGKALLSVQKWMDQVARDIVDESDENFSVSFELVYTMGTQQSIDLSLQRWSIIQKLLGTVVKLCEEMHQKGLRGIQCDRSHRGTIPVIRILESPAGWFLVRLLAEHVCESGVEGFPIHRQPKAFRDLVLVYITRRDVPEHVVQAVENEKNGFYCDTTRGPLLLLRGLFFGGVLAFALSSKRWRVNFGRTRTRSPETLLAVPFQAKDSPTLRSEFSHPDVVILLTCLTYYYEGLTDDELDVSFARLDRADQTEFSRWISDAPQVKPAYRQLSGVNLKDRQQCVDHIYPAIRYSKAAIDFYLDRVVFARHMKEFPRKLSASGWDMARQTSYPLTGFSGTCDSKYVLPLQIKHLDLPEQKHTNASVLRCLLRPENGVRELRASSDSTDDEVSFSDLLLTSVIESDVPIQVILDVGAQILDLDNVEAAKKWLKMMPNSEFEAVIYFDADDELSVVNSSGLVERLLTSPYLKLHEKCLVFLDEGHTRGTDLKLPEHYRAAVTLGPKLTKDRLVQACMRMRKLGAGQSVTFFILPEIQQRIRKVRQIPCETALTVADVLIWSISETWADSRRSIPLWATQGIRHQKQEIIWQNNVVYLNRNADPIVDGFKEYLDDEAQMLAERYAPRAHSKEVSLQELRDSKFASRREQLSLIEQKCREHNSGSFGSADLQEQQERELSPEIEQERQIEMPAPQEPARHSLSQAVKEFVSTGCLPTNHASPDFLPAFAAFEESTADAFFDSLKFPCDIYVTRDFATTVEPGWQKYTSDAYQRPVQWIVSARHEDVNNNNSQKDTSLVIMSPWEVDMLYKELKASRFVHLHLYTPRTNLAYPSLDHLRLFSVPPLPETWRAPAPLVAQLNLFAGQLWLQSYDEYVQICRFLGLSCSTSQGEESIAADGFEGKTERNPDCVFDTSPVALLKAVISGIRADCQKIERTHLGRILGGEILRLEDFEDREDIGLEN